MKSHNLTTADVAELLGYDIQHIRRLAASGSLPAVKRRRQWFFNKADVLVIFEPNNTTTEWITEDEANDE